MYEFMPELTAIDYLLSLLHLNNKRYLNCTFVSELFNYPSIASAYYLELSHAYNILLSESSVHVKYKAEGSQIIL